MARVCVGWRVNKPSQFLIADGLVIPILVVKTGATAMQVDPQGCFVGFVTAHWIDDHKGVIAAEAAAVGIVAIEI